MPVCETNCMTAVKINELRNQTHTTERFFFSFPTSSSLRCLGPLTESHMEHVWWERFVLAWLDCQTLHPCCTKQKRTISARGSKGGVNWYQWSLNCGSHTVKQNSNAALFIELYCKIRNILLKKGYILNHFWLRKFWSDLTDFCFSLVLLYTTLHGLEAFFIFKHK